MAAPRKQRTETPPLPNHQLIPLISDLTEIVT
jgi:hypothetical protein